MTDSKPYLIRAIYEWICDNEHTPYLYIDTQFKGLLLPEHLYAENPLVLNICPTACNNLQLGNDEITLQARFSGKVFDIYLPITSVMAIVTRENGLGMTFQTPLDESDKSSDTDADKDKPNKKPVKKKAGLKVIK